MSSKDKDLEQLLRNSGSEFRAAADKLLAETDFQRLRRSQISTAVLSASTVEHPRSLKDLLRWVFAQPLTVGAAAAAAFALTLVMTNGLQSRSVRVEQFAQTAEQSETDSQYVQLAMADAYSDFRDDFDNEVGELLSGDPMSFEIGSFAPEEMPTLVGSNEYITEEETTDEATIGWF
ncbi:MAG: hypothetical protein KDD66_12715 [Bdellovibrionales bacterium]|nr:hypothetical protein [Bdellovibrionales bacterium]